MQSNLESLLKQFGIIGLYLLIANYCIAQITEPNRPTFEKQKLPEEYYFNSSLLDPTSQSPNVNKYGTHLSGGNAQGVSQQMHKGYSSTNILSVPSGNRIIQSGYGKAQDPNQYIQQYNEMLAAQKYYHKQQELIKVLNEIRADDMQRSGQGYSPKSLESNINMTNYNEALAHLKDMLSGKQKLSIKKAYYEMESAYGDTYMSEEEYETSVNQSVEFIKKWLVQNGYSLKDNEALHWGIQQFMGDTLTIKTKPLDGIKAAKVIHYPFFYDFDDYKGEKDIRNYFTTKTLATGTGQCSSLPAVYLVLAEGLGAKAYLSFAPQHSFVKYPDNKGNIHNYEPTSNWRISDQWYQDDMFISPEAIRTGIYLDTLNSKQIVADCILNLAFGYLKKHGVGDGKFIKECIHEANLYFPKENCLESYLLFSSVVAHLLDNALNENHVKDLKDIEKYPAANYYYQVLKANEQTLEQLGYQELPGTLYQDLMEEHEFKGKKRKENNVATKEKKNLFIKTNF